MRGRSSILAALVVIGAMLSPAWARAQDAQTPTPGSLYENGPDGRYLLGGDWLVRLDPSDVGLRSGYATASSTDGWNHAEVPYAFNADDFSDASQRGSVAWYRKDFKTPADSRAMLWVLRFEMVNYRATVYLNGRKIGYHDGAYLPFEVDARGIAARGQVNRLVVRVDSRHTSSSLPPGGTTADGRPGGGWWNYGGITREVYLRRVGAIDFSDVHVEPHLRCRTCAVNVDVTAVVRNRSKQKRRLSIVGNFGGVALRFGGSKKVSAGREATFTARVVVHHPRLWSPGSPSLYKTSLRGVASGTSARPAYTVKVGLRKLAVSRGGRFLLNFKPFHPNGASMHEEDPDVGSAMTNGQRRADVDLLERLGATITRAHYPLHPYTLELLDQAGIMVWDEAPVYQLSAQALRSRVLRTRALRFVRGQVLRDRNHPSVVTWSIANELPSDTAPHRALLEDLIATVRSLDDTRLVALDVQGYPSVPLQPVYRELDAIGINDYFGWYPGPNGSVSDRESLGPYLDQMHRFYPRQAIFITEFGAEANREGPIDEKGTYSFQKDFLRYHLDVFSQKAFVNGAIIWILRDFRVKPGWDGGNPKPEPPVNFKGLASQTGEPKPAFDEIARRFKAARR